jgi:hypothetical protein
MMIRYSVTKFLLLFSKKTSRYKSSTDRKCVFDDLLLIGLILRQPIYNEWACAYPAVQIGAG